MAERPASVVLDDFHTLREASVSNKTITERLQALSPGKNVPFAITKIGHVVLNCRDLERSVRFYTQILGFKISDIYEPDMVPGGMVFMRFNTDHHGVGLVGAMSDYAQNIELHHLAFEVATLDELLRLREHLEKNNVTIDFTGRRRAGGQIAVEFADPDGHQLEIFWGLDQVASDDVVRPRSEWRPARSLEEAINNPVRGQNPIVRDESLLRR
jgi:catechol 2,3-dioxygenase-like lactoylglutathione lyase family enzyme